MLIDEFIALLNRILRRYMACSIPSREPSKKGTEARGIIVSLVDVFGPIKGREWKGSGSCERSRRVNVNTTDATAGAPALLLPAQNTHT